MNKIERPILVKEDLRLQQRAKRLAKPVGIAEIDKPAEYMTFELAKKTYALDSSLLVSVGTYRQMTPLTLHGGLVRGVVNWQGSILGILNLQNALGQPVQEIDLVSGHMLAVGRQQAEWGLAVDRILDLVPISPADIKQCRLSYQEMDDGLIIGRLQSEVWLLNGQTLLNRMDKLLDR
jgi:chemotaxis signal transduction protein